MGLLDPADWAAGPVGAPSDARQWADFALEVDFTLVTDAVGVFFRAQGAGDAFMWQVANFGGNPTLRPHARVGGTWSLLDEIAVDHVIAPDEFDGRTHRLRVEAEGETLRTYLNDEHVDTRSDATHDVGTIGFRTSGAETGVIHHVRVLEGDALVFEEDFSAGNPFGGGTLADGSLEVSGNTEALLGAAQAMPLLRRDFAVDGDVERARVYASALGVYELRINGERVGDHVFAPGWTDYDTRVQYQTLDVTDLLADGDNTIGGMLGEGWYAGHVGLAGRNVYGDEPFLLAQLEITYADGSTQTVATDASWRSSDGPVLASDMLMGEDYDARADQPGWDAPGFDAAGWQPVQVGDEDLTARLVAQVDEPVAVTEELDAVELTEPEPGTYVFDLGQNMVGNVRLRVDGGEAGDTVTLRHAEVLNPDGTLYTANLRSAQATNTYTKAGDGTEVYEPYFTFHGFRYVEVTGYPGEPDPDAVTGRVMHTAAPFTAEFTTSNPMLDQLQSNIVWGQRGNFLSVPTDTRHATSGWAGPATSTCSPGRRRSTWTSPASCPSG